jgi:hypothetical protein
VILTGNSRKPHVVNAELAKCKSPPATLVGGTNWLAKPVSKNSRRKQTRLKMTYFVCWRCNIQLLSLFQYQGPLKASSDGVKKVACSLLETLRREKLVLDWRKKQQA